MLSSAERLRIYGSPEAVAEADAYLDRLAAEAPPLTASQKARLRALIAPPVTAAPVIPAPRRGPHHRQAA